MFIAYVYFLNLFWTVVNLYSRIENIFDDFYLLNIIQKIIQSFILFSVFCFVCMRRCFHSFNFKYIWKMSIHNCNSCVNMKCNCCSIYFIELINFYKCFHNLNIVFEFFDDKWFNFFVWKYFMTVIKFKNIVI